MLLLIALATLTPVYAVSSQDLSRLCLTRSMLAGRLTIAPCVGHGVDRARYGGRVYSDKAPGMSLLAVPAVELTQLPSSPGWNVSRDLRLWAVRVLTSGLAFLVLAFALGRVAEGLEAGTGALTAVTFACGTVAAGLAATTFDEVTAGALAFGAFLIAWRGRPVWAGVIAGLAVVVEYQAALVAAALAVYVALRGLRGLGRYVLGALVGVAPVAVYDRAAFGSPFHASYRYVANGYARAQASGFFGISLPRAHSISLVFLGDRGLLVASPVLIAAAAGLALLARDRRREAGLCAVVTLLFLLLEVGYFLPYGGVSPGPRFLIPALPFLAVGLAPAFGRLRGVTTLLAIPSLIASVTLMLTWAWGSVAGYRQTVWGELARAVAGSHSRLRGALASNVLTTVGLDNRGSAFFVAACVCLAFAVALPPLRRRGRLEVNALEAGS